MSDYLQLWGYSNEPATGTALVVTVILAVVAVAVIGAYAVFYLRHLRHAVVEGEPSGKRMPGIGRVAAVVGGVFAVAAVAAALLFPNPADTEGDALTALDMGSATPFATLATSGDMRGYVGGATGSASFARVYYPDGTVPESIPGFTKTVEEEDGVTFTVFQLPGHVSPFQPEVVVFATVTDPETKRIDLTTRLLGDGTAGDAGHPGLGQEITTRAPINTGSWGMQIGNGYLSGDTVVFVGRLRAGHSARIDLDLYREDGWLLPDTYDDIDPDDLKDYSAFESAYRDRSWDPETAEPDHTASLTIARGANNEQDLTGQGAEAEATARKTVNQS
ncbi:hypothetical protein QJ043_04145 [Olsenella sp. YH-ols2217]|uniref:Uncharacterized protein n=1 Tax=Kribbibacterium absianum TaxID=3044210 RepID=A0ABT6ZJN9_9ACTN|nr:MULTISPECIES: hypothetical protein [unclassified Olsenella]MDJ1122748.1 hypothetical protein [Olsenella sp. YH-ols2216]MDJ1129269.1 hypothetical protein [Olsenella sp. YH-ols2217]